MLTLIILIMNNKDFRKTYPYICSECGEFNHSLREYCENCGAQNSLISAKKADYKASGHA